MDGKLGGWVAGCGYDVGGRHGVWAVWDEWKGEWVDVWKRVWRGICEWEEGGEGVE